MKRSFTIFFLLVLCLHHGILLAQKSPIVWLNKSININVDTTANMRGGIYGSNLNYEFRNEGEHVTFIDKSKTFDDYSYTTKPKETSTIILKTHRFLDDNNKNDAIEKKRDTTTVLKLPFYYEGKIFQEEITCHFSFGKSQLIKIKRGSLKFDATEIVRKLSNENSKSEFTLTIEITNISKKPISCPKSLVAWDDVGGIKNGGDKLVIIMPGKSYVIPIEMKMGSRTIFSREGMLEIFSNDVYETFNCLVFSNYNPNMK